MTPADAKARALEALDQISDGHWHGCDCHTRRTEADPICEGIQENLATIRTALDMLDALAAENATLKEGRTT